MDWAWDGVLFSPLFTAILFVFWIVLIVTLIGSLMDGGEEARAYVRAARELLDERLWRGEIDREEYVDRRKAVDQIAAIV
jgi:uncharacterized membrane protein